MHFDRIALYLDEIPAAVFAAREEQIIARLRAARPGRRSRVIFARAMEAALFDGAEIKRAIAALMVPPRVRPWTIHGVPDVNVQRKIDRAVCRPRRTS